MDEIKQSGGVGNAALNGALVGAQGAILVGAVGLTTGWPGGVGVWMGGGAGLAAVVTAAVLIVADRRRT